MCITNPSTRQVHNLHMAQAIRYDQRCISPQAIYTQPFPFTLLPYQRTNWWLSKASLSARRPCFLTLHHLQLERGPIEGPIPSIPDFTAEDPRQFARLWISLDNLLPLDATEQFKYQILLEHLKFEETLLIADSYSNSRYPYTQTMQSLTEHYGQPHQLALQKIADLMDGPIIRSGDTQAFRRFALRVRVLVGMPDQLDEKGAIELQCGSHVARLLSKLPHDLKANFKRYVHHLKNPIPNLLDFAHWLEFELQVQSTDSKLNTIETRGRAGQQKEAPRQRKHPFIQQPFCIV